MKHDTTPSASVQARLARCVRGAMRPAWHTARWLLKITVPVSLAVLLLKTSGALEILARWTEPIFSIFGLPGEAALVFVTSALLNNYSAIVVMGTLGLTGRAITILALMCLISHNLPVETAVQRKVGSSAIWILIARLSCSVVGGIALNAFLPADAIAISPINTDVIALTAGFRTELLAWLIDTAWLCGKILVLVTGLMVLQRILEEFGVTRFLGRIMKWPLVLLGVPQSAAFLWIVANTLGLAYGAGVIIEHVESGKLSRRDADLLNYHIAISHSLLEDTFLFAAIGAAVGWITLPRVLLAGAVVWIRRLVASSRLKA